jgi:hypothetical protein
MRIKDLEEENMPLFNQAHVVEVELGRLRWPDGFRYPACGGGKAWLTQPELLHCSTWQRPTSVNAGMASLSALANRCAPGFWRCGS